MSKKNNFNTYLLWGSLICTMISLLFVGPVWEIASSKFPSALFIERTWVIWFFIPIPFITMILGIINLLYRKSLFWIINIVVGFIISAVLFFSGCFFMIFPSFRTEYDNVSYYNDVLKVDLPVSGVFTKEERAVYFDDDKKNVVIVKAFYEKQEYVSNFEKNIKNSSEWLLSTEIKTEIQAFIPYQMKPFENDKSYYLIYIKEINEYDTLPKENGLYRVIVAKYKIDDNELEINEFDYEVK